MSHKSLRRLAFGALLGCCTWIVTGFLAGCGGSTSPDPDSRQTADASDAEREGADTSGADAASGAGKRTNAAGGDRSERESGDSEPRASSGRDGGVASGQPRNSAQKTPRDGSPRTAATSKDSKPSPPSRPTTSEKRTNSTRPLDGFAPPPSIAGNQFVQLGEAEGNPKQLKRYIENVEGELARITDPRLSPEAVIAKVAPLLTAKLEAADKILALDSEDSIREFALKTKLKTISDLEQMQQPGMEDKRRELGEQLLREKSPAFARQGRFILFYLMLKDIREGELDKIDKAQADKMLAEATAIIEQEPKDESVMDIAEATVKTLQVLNRAEDADKILNLTGTVFVKEAKDPVFVSRGQDILDHLKMEKLQFEPSLNLALQGHEDAAKTFMIAVNEMAKAPNPRPYFFQFLAAGATQLEIAERYQICMDVYSAIENGYANHENRELAEFAAKTAQNGRTRIAMVGKPFEVQGKTRDGAELDWTKYRNKVVVVDFWATWSPGFTEALPNLRRQYELYKESGLEVVGVNLDEDQRQVDRFLARNDLPWESVYSFERDALVWDAPMAKKYGVDSIPFVVLVDRHGETVALNARGDMLNRKLAQLLGAPKRPARAADDEEEEEEEEEVKSKADKPRPRKRPSAEVPGSRGTDAIQGGSAGSEGEIEPSQVPESKASAETEVELNPYAAPEGLTPQQLVDFIFEMEEKPKSIQRRTGFSQALIEAADTILANQPSAKLEQIALLTKFRLLHNRACEDDAAGEAALNALVEQLQHDTRGPIRAEVQHLQLERRVLDSDALAVDRLPELLAELKTFFEGRELTARHLRIASSTVHVINRLEDPQEREKRFTEFGSQFAKSTDRELARYGRKLAQQETTESELIGKPLDVVATTVLGENFNWASYRGKVVLVDFWATWCGPCRREMPHVKQSFDQWKGQGFDVVGISLDRDPEALTAYLDEHRFPWTTLAGDEALAFAEKCGVRGIPTMLLVDRTGQVVAVSHDVSSLATQAQSLLQTP